MKRKRTKKIILAVVMLVIVVSIFSLNVFADTWITTTEETTRIASNMGTFTQYRTLNTGATEAISLTLADIIATPQPNRNSQSWNGRKTVTRLLDLNNTTEFDYEYTGIYFNSRAELNNVITYRDYIQYRNLRDTTNGLNTLFGNSFKWVQTNFIYNQTNRNATDTINIGNFSTSSNIVVTWTVNYLIETIDYKTGKVKTNLVLPYETSLVVRGDTTSYPIPIIPTTFNVNNVTIIDNDNNETYERTDGVKILSSIVEIKNQDETQIALNNASFNDYINAYSLNENTGERTPITISDLEYSWSVADLYDIEYNEAPIVTVQANDFWDFIKTSIGGFFDFEIVPNITIGGILGTLLVIFLMIIVMRVFAGG